MKVTKLTKKPGDANHKKEGNPVDKQPFDGNCGKKVKRKKK